MSLVIALLWNFFMNLFVFFVFFECVSAHLTSSNYTVTQNSLFFTVILLIFKICKCKIIFYSTKNNRTKKTLRQCVTLEWGFQKRIAWFILLFYFVFSLATGQCTIRYGYEKVHFRLWRSPATSNWILMFVERGTNATGFFSLGSTVRKKWACANREKRNKIKFYQFYLRVLTTQQIITFLCVRNSCYIRCVFFILFWIRITRLTVWFLCFCCSPHFIRFFFVQK